MKTRSQSKEEMDEENNKSIQTDPYVPIIIQLNANSTKQPKHTYFDDDGNEYDDDSEYILEDEANEYEYEDQDEDEYEEEEEEEEEEEDEDPSKKSRRNVSRVLQEIKSYYDENDVDYFRNLSTKRKKVINDIEKQVYALNHKNTPLRFRILESDMDVTIKAIALGKCDQMVSMERSDSEYHKMNAWIEGLCKLPIGKYKDLPIGKDAPVDKISDFLDGISTHLDKAVYGHKDTKSHIIRLLAKWISNKNSKGLVIGLQGPPGIGKCHAYNTPILMFDGSIKPVQDVMIGDYLMGDDSTPREVLSLARGKDHMYEIKNEEGETYIVNSEHILCLKYYDSIIEKIQEVTMPVKHFIKLPSFVKSQLFGYKTPVEFPFQKTTLQPYGMGLYIPSQKVPNEYKVNTRYNRLRFLAGIIDSRGLLNNKTYAYEIYENGSFKAFDDTFEADEFKQDLVFIAKSLGFIAHDMCTHIFITGRDLSVIPVLRKSKMINITSCDLDSECGDHDPLMSQIQVREVGRGQYYGFELSGNRKYVMGNFIVTHNTSIAMEICQCLGLPFGFTSLSGISTAEMLKGFQYTYIGSRHGAIADILMRSKFMNPIFFFDELDKVSATSEGDEIIGTLIHITDHSQNHKYQDRYFSDVDLDLSRSLMIFSYNVEENINPVLRDRMIKVNISGYSNKDKIRIVQDFLLEKALTEYGFQKGDIILTDDVINNIIDCVDHEEGVRNLKRGVEEIISQLNLHKLLKKEVMPSVFVELPFKVSRELVDQYCRKKGEKRDTLNMMYM